MQDEPDPIPHLQHKLLNAALALIVIYAQLTTIFVMSSETPESNKSNANWNIDETNELVQYLWDHRAEAGDGGNFKSQTLTAAMQHITPYHSQGPVKDVKHVKRKWTAVSDQCIFTDFLLM